MRIPVTASRDWTDEDGMRAVFTSIRGRHVLVHGACRGGDLMAKSIALDLGWTEDPDPVSDEEWRMLGKRAGPIRNARMVDSGVEICLGFPLSTSIGTINCMRYAMSEGVRVVEIGPERSRTIAMLVRQGVLAGLDNVTAARKACRVILR